MARIAGVDLPNDKRVEIGLTYIYGIGRKSANDILKEAGIKPKSVLEIDRLVTLYTYIEMGTAASLVSDTLVKNLSHHKGNVVYYKINSKYAKRNIFVSYKKNKYYSKAMEAFVSLIFEMTESERN